MKAYEYRLIYLVPDTRDVYRDAYFYTREDLDSFIRKLKLVTFSIQRC